MTSPHQISLLLVIIYVVTNLPLFAAEVDSFAARNRQLADSGAAATEVLNGLIQTAVDRSNATGACVRPQFHKILLEQGGGLFDPKFGLAVLRHPDTESFSTPCEESVYSDIAAFKFLSCALPTAPVMRFGTVYFGSEKLAHFWALGYEYFEKMHSKHESLVDVLEYGEYTESTYLGAWPSGVYSYADLAANYEGLRFWERVVGVDGDTGEIEPYVVCEQNKWRLAKRADMGDYITGAWDEAINRSAYVSEKIGQRVDAATTALGTNFKDLQNKYCVQLSKRYEENGQYLLSDECLNSDGISKHQFGFLTRWANGISVNATLLAKWIVYRK